MLTNYILEIIPHAPKGYNLDKDTANTRLNTLNFKRKPTIAYKRNENLEEMLTSTHDVQCCQMILKLMGHNRDKGLHNNMYRVLALSYVLVVHQYTEFIFKFIFVFKDACLQVQVMAD